MLGFFIQVDQCYLIYLCYIIVIGLDYSTSYCVVGWVLFNFFIFIFLGLRFFGEQFGELFGEQETVW